MRAEPNEADVALVLGDSLCIVAIACRNFFSCEHALTGGEGRYFAEFTRYADAHIFWRSRRQCRAAARAFALYKYAAQKLWLGGGHLGQFSFVIAAVGGGMSLRRCEQQGCAQSKGSSKRAHAGRDLGESHNVFLKLC